MSRSPVLLLILGLAAAGCPRADAPAPEKAAEGPPVLEAVAVDSKVLAATVPLPGELLPYQAVALFPRVPGFVEELAVDRGSVVRAGQVLGRLSAPELKAQRSEADAKAHADDSTLQRLRLAAGTPGAVSRHELELAESAARSSAARAAALRTQEEYLLLKAPFDGVVTERNVHPGALVGPPAGAGATPLLRIEEVSRLRLTVAVPESYLAAAKEGLAVEFSVRAWPGERFAAKVGRVAHALDGKTRTMAIELDVDNRTGRLASGMFAEVAWPLRRSGPSLVVPASAVVRTTERTLVSRVHDGVLTQVPVTLGAAVGDRVEIFGELAAGELVLRRGREELGTGTRVEARVAATAHP